MWEVEETERIPPLQRHSDSEWHVLDAATYRRLWLESEDRLGLIAETLAEVLGWQPTHEQPLPDALALAQAAAIRLKSPRAEPYRHRVRRRGLHSHHFALN